MTLRYLGALLGGFVAMFAHIFFVLRNTTFFDPQRWGMSLGVALIFAHIFALMVVSVCDFLPARKLPRPVRMALMTIFGVVLGTMAWWSHSTLFLYIVPPPWETLILGGAGLASGFIITGAFPVTTLPTSIMQMIITSLAIYLPIAVAYQSFLVSNTPALLYFQRDNPDHVFIIGIPFAISLTIFAYLPTLWELRQAR